MQYTVTFPDSQDIGITAARLAYNRSLPGTVAGPLGVDGAPGGAIANPALITDNAAYMAWVFGNAVTHWAESLQGAWRIPVGKWLQRWTDAEKLAVRQLGAQDAQVQAWLNEIDRNEFVNLTHDSVVIGVPAVCAALEQLGVIAAGQASERAAAVQAMDI